MASEESGSTPAPAPEAVVVDTSAWVSRLLTQDSNHTAARDWIERHLLNGGLLVAPALLVTEVAAAVSRQTGQPSLARSAVNQLNLMTTVRLMPVDQDLIDAATDLASDLGIRGADALFVATAMQLSIPLVTFDTEQLQRPGAIITTIRP